MAAGNEVTVTGNLTSDIDLKVTKSGDPVASFSIAWNKRSQKDGEWTETPNFFDVTVWGPLAENCAKSFRKGSRVIVVGRLEQNRWEDRESGQQRSKVVLVADDVGGSARWATVDMVKNEPSGGGSRRGQDDRGYRDDRGRDDRGSDRGRSRRDSYDDEVPF